MTDPDQNQHVEQLEKELAQLDKERAEISSQAIRMIGDSCIPWTLLLMSVFMLLILSSQTSFLRWVALVPGLAGIGLIYYFSKKNREKSRLNQERMKALMAEAEQKKIQLRKLKES